MKRFARAGERGDEGEVPAVAGLRSDPRFAGGKHAKGAPSDEEEAFEGGIQQINGANGAGGSEDYIDEQKNQGGSYAQHDGGEAGRRRTSSGR